MGIQNGNGSIEHQRQTGIKKDSRPIEGDSAWKKTNFSIESNSTKSYNIQQMTGQPNTFTTKEEKKLKK